MESFDNFGVGKPFGKQTGLAAFAISQQFFYHYNASARMRVFLSHSSRDKGFVDSVTSLLKPGTFEQDSTRHSTRG
jgi:hypothetical protein